MKRFYFLLFSIACLIIGHTSGYAQDSLRITAPTAYPCIGGGSVPLGDIGIAELIPGALPANPGADSTIVLRISNASRFEFDISSSANLERPQGQLNLASEVVQVFADSVHISYRLAGNVVNPPLDSLVIRGIRVRAKGSTPGVAEIVRSGGTSNWPDIQVADNITFATLISVTSANQSISAGSDQTKCFPESFSLTGALNLSYPFADTVLWSTTNGSGTFSSNNNRNTTYVPAAADTNLSGPIQIRFTLANNNCPNLLEDALLLTLNKRVFVEAGPVDTVCANGPFQLNGSIVQGVTTAPGVWSGGNGTFSPNANTLNAQYTPSIAEVAGTGFILRLTSSVAACQPVTDSVRLVSNPKNRPSINAGADQTLCRGATVALNATVANLGIANLSWTKASTAAGGSFSLPTIPNPVYTPSTADYDSGFVRLALSTAGGPCGFISDTIQINFLPLPVASLVCFDPDTTICAGQSIGFQAFGGSSYRFSINGVPQGPGASSTSTFTSTTFANGDSIRAQVFSGASGTGCVSTSNAFRVRVNPIPATPTWTAPPQNFANNAPPINLDSIGTRSVNGGSYSGSVAGVVGNFLLPTLMTPATTNLIAYRITVDGCASTPSASITFNLFDPNQPFAGLAANYCFNDPPDTIFASKTSIPSGQSFHSFGFLNGSTFIPFSNVTDVGASIRAIFTPSVLGSAVNGGTGAKQIVFRTNFIGLPFSVVNTTIQTTTINPNPVVTITNKLSGFICEGNFADSIQVSVSTSNPGSYVFTNAVSIVNGWGRYNTINDGVLPVFPGGPRTSTVTFTETGTGCSGSDNAVFTVDQLPPAPSLPVTDVLLCIGEPIPVFTAGVVSAGLPTGANPQIFWFSDTTSTTTGILAANSGQYPLSGSGSIVYPSTDTIYLRQRTYGYCFGQLARIIVNINIPPTVNAGTPITVCEGQTIPIDGSVLNAPVGLTTTWSTATPNPGTFTSTSLLTGVTYTPSLDDRNRGFVRVRLTTSDPDGSGQGCPLQFAEVRHNINRVATLFAGNDTVICAGTPTVLRPAIAPTTLGGQWFPELPGTFSSGATVPTQQNFRPDSASLSLTAPTNIRMVFRTDDPDDVGPCTAIEDTMFIRVNPRNFLNAGRDSVYCESADTLTSISLLSTAIGASFIGNPATPLIWSANGSHNGFLNASNQPDSLYRLDNTRARTYRATAADVQRGFVWLVLTALDPDGAEPCTPVVDSIRIQINRRPRVNAGLDQTICSQDSAQLNAILGGPSNVAGEWLLGTGTFFRQGPIPNKRLYTDAVYRPSAGEISATAVTTVTLRWQTNDTDSSGPCPIVEDELTLTINPRAVVSAGNLTDTICAGQVFTFAGSVGGGASLATWLNGLGTFAPSTTSPTAVYTPASSEIPLTTNNNSILFRLATNDPDGAGPCLADTVSKRLVISRIPIVLADSAGRDTLIICAGESVRLTGRLAGSATAGGWKGGTGVFSGAGRVINTSTQAVFYTPNASDTNEVSSNQVRYITLILGSNTFQRCDTVNDTVVVRVNPAPVVNAGPDLVICAGDSIQMGGSFSGSTGAVVWKGGLGAFRPNRNDANAWYIPHPSEIPFATASRTLSFQLFSNDPDGFDPITGPCDSVFDVKTLTINRIRTVVADTGGRDTVVYCSGDVYRLAAGFSVPGTTVTWSGGTGTFSTPGERFTSYIPGIGETNASAPVFIQLRVTTDDPDSISPSVNGPCGRVMDDVILRVNPSAIVNAGPDLVICAGDSTQLGGSLSGSTGTVVWKGGLGTFVPNRNDANAWYIPHPSEIPFTTPSNTITFQLFSNDPDGFDPVTGPCDSVFDVKTLTINRIRTVVADTGGRDTVVYCRGAEFRLAAGFSVSGTTVTWSGGTGTFSTPGLPFTSYTPGPGEGDTTQIVYVRLRVTTDDPDSLSPTNNGPCGRVFDEVILRIDPAVVINAGADLRYCTSQPIQLFGSIGGSATLGTWSGGANTFNNPNLLNAVYLPSPVELVQDTTFNLILFADSLPGGTCPSKSDTVQVSLFANPVLTITMPDTQFCNLPITINSTLNAQIVGKNPVAASVSSVTGSGVTSVSIANFTFNPTVAGNGLKTITYAFTRLVSENSCFSDTTIQVVVHPQPRSALQWSGTCQGDTLFFSDSSRLDTVGQFTPNSIVGWAWDFDLGSIAQDSINGIPSDSSFVQNPSYFYRTPGVKRPSLTVVTNNGCFNRTDSIFAIGARTKPDFTWSFVCPADSTEYFDTLSVTSGAGNITFRRWVFGSGTVLQGADTSFRRVKHQYPGPGAYNTRLALTTQFGCVDSIERTVNILASTAPTPLAPYVQDFDTNNGFWVSGGTNNDWAYGRATDTINKVIKPKYPTDRYWATTLDSFVYRNSQASFVNGPCVNFLNLDKPMLVFDYRSQTTEGQDGAVVQYSINGGINWILLGTLNSGINWYNRRDLSGNPGNQLIGNFGWNGKGEWRTARHSLDVIKSLPDSLQQKVRFRVVFGSDASSFLGDTTEGFAFDNVRIEDRTRIVLLEFFNTVGAPGSDANNDVFTNIIENMSKDAVGTSYYISGVNDPINRRNPADPSARALYYGVSAPNEVVFNGRGVFPLALRDSIGEKRIELQSLLPPKLKLDVLGLNATQAAATVSVRLEAKDSIPANARLYVGLIESVVYIPSVTNPGTLRDFSWVLRKIVPSAAGVLLDATFDAPGDTLLYTFTGSLEGGLVDNLSRLGVVAYVQNIETKEIEQAAIFRGSDWNVIGIQDGLLEASEVQVFPNPAHDRVHVVLNEPAERPLNISLYDMLGKQVASETLERASFRLDLTIENLRGGMYLLKIEDDRGVVQITKKLLVQH